MVDDVSVDIEMLLVTNFINLKIKSTQFFRCAHWGRGICACIHMGECSYMYKYVHLCLLSLHIVPCYGVYFPDGSRLGQIRLRKRITKSKIGNKLAGAPAAAPS
jgi:hypothetical protein